MKQAVSTIKVLKQIVIDDENYKSLKLMGHTGDSFNDVIKRLLKDKIKNSSTLMDKNSLSITSEKNGQ